MSSVRRSSRLAADSSTPKITSYGSVKRVTKNRDRTPGFDKTEFESPKVLTLQTPKNKVETPKFIFETPKKKLTPKTVAEVPSTARRRILRDEDAAQSNKTTPKKVKRRLDPDSPPKVFSSSSNESVVNSEISSTSDPYSPPRTPKKRIIVETPESNSSKLSFTEETADANKSPGLPIGLTTPKSARRRLFADEESPSSKCDLFFSTFQSNTPASTRSGLGSISRTGESGQYSRLAPQVKEAMNIPLPQKYQTLFDTFEMMERIVCIFKTRSKRLLFEDVRKDVQRKLHKNFSTTMLAQILGVYPTSYSVKVEGHSAVFGKNTPGKTYDMVLEANLKDDLEPYWKPESPIKTPSTPQYGTPVKLVSVGGSPRKNTDFIPFSPKKSPTKATPQKRELMKISGERLDAWRMACRKAIFRYKLLLPVHEAHREFLEKIKANIDDLEDGKFHEKFNLESVPDPVTAELPQPPKKPVQKSIKEFLTPETPSFALPKGIESTLERLKSPEKPTHSENGRVPLSPTKFAKSATESGGDTPKLSLYERIMLKQKAREERMLPERLARQKKLNQLEFLNEALFSSVWTHFSRISPKTVTNLADLLFRIGKDVKLTGEECQEHIELLCDVASKYFDCYSAGLLGQKYVRYTSSDENDYQNIRKLIINEYEKLSKQII